jgi:tRNA threonylcarbamoyladenosine modification (KEOPS) complex Cgi121 subunit/molybdopterin converting factor small subunit
MITVRLLGGAKKAVGKPAVTLEKQSATVSEILKYLDGISSNSRLLQPNNLIVAINGIDSASLQGGSTVVKSGDSVTIVTVVHGGADTIEQISIIGVSSIREEPGRLVDRLRLQNRDVVIQAVDAGAVYGLDHVVEVFRITLEAEKRKIMIANKVETELLLRLACTDQISEAIKRAGLKKDEPGCFIAISQNNAALQQFVSFIKDNFGTDDSVIGQSNEKQINLSRMLGISTGRFNEFEFLQYLVERAAILVK